VRSYLDLDRRKIERMGIIPVDDLTLNLEAYHR
jgi:hypothetical protein